MRHSIIYETLTREFEILSSSGISPGSISLSAVLVAAQYIAHAESITVIEGRDKLIRILSQVPINDLKKISYTPVVPELPHTEEVMNRIFDSITASLHVIGDGHYYPIEASSVLCQLSIQLFAVHQSITPLEANSRLIEYLRTVPIELMETVPIETVNPQTT